MKKKVKFCSLILIIFIFSVSCFREVIRNKTVTGIVYDTTNSPIQGKVITFHGEENGKLGTAGKEFEIKTTTDQEGKFSVSLPFKSRIKIYWLYEHAIYGYKIIKATPLISDSYGFTYKIADTTNTSNLRIIVKKF